MSEVKEVLMNENGKGEKPVKVTPKQAAKQKAHEVDYWMHEYPDLTREEVIELLEAVDIGYNTHFESN